MTDTVASKNIDLSSWDTLYTKMLAKEMNLSTVYFDSWTGLL
jgi:hypothetical protein